MSEPSLTFFQRQSLTLIHWYQRVWSPDHSPRQVHYPYGYCRFTCSEYTAQAITKFGVFRGSILGMWRILRCQPWSRGGHDPIP